MANHKSAQKRIRNSETKNERNRYQAKSARTIIKKIRTSTDKKEAAEMLPKIAAMLDKLAKTNVIHKNKASNLKSELTIQVNKMK
jgi:small subunit ribosomal protein S20